MIIKLSGADFSTNNLGTIQLSRELSVDTLTILSKYTKAMTDTQKFAVQDFINGLKTNGLWANIGNLYLPILAGQKSESLYNVKTGIVDATPSSGYELTTNGMKSISTTTGDITSVNYNGSQKNLHLFAYNTESLTTGEYLFGNSSTQLIQITINSSLNITAKTDGNTAVNLTSGAVKATPGLKGIVQSTDGNIAVGRVSDSIYTTPMSTDNTYTNFPVGLLGIKNFQTQVNNVHYGLFSMGASLTLAQVNTYKTLADAFMTAMGIAV